MCGALALADGSTWLVFDGEGCQFTYDTRLHVRRLHRELRGRYVPVSAVRRVDYTPPGQGRRRGSLRLVLHPGVDPILAVIGEERADSLYPYQVEVDRANHPTARRLRELIAEAVKASPPNHRAGFLLPGPELPCRLRGVDGAAEFDGHAVRFTWRWASAAKTAAGPTRTVPLSVIDGVQWVDGSQTGRGVLRIRVAGSDDAGPAADFGDDH